MFDRKVRCIDCGFLGHARASLETDEPKRRVISFDWADEPASLGVRQRMPDLLDSQMGPFSARMYDCGLQVLDVETETEGIPPPPEELVAMIKRPRQCSYFEKFQPMLSFREHFDLKLKRRERWWGAVGAAAGIVLTAAATQIDRLFG